MSARPCPECAVGKHANCAPAQCPCACPEPDREGLPAGYVPVWTYLAWRDGVAEVEHPAGEALRRARGDAS